MILVGALHLTLKTLVCTFIPIGGIVVLAATEHNVLVEALIILFVITFIPWLVYTYRLAKDCTNK